MTEIINTNLDTTPLPPNNLVAKDPQSAELAGYVRTKTFGREVREAIARSIELNSTRSKNAENVASETVNVANDLTERFNQQIGALTEDAEVIDARGGFTVLSERLKAIGNFVSYEGFVENSNTKYFNPADGKYYLEPSFETEYLIDDGIEIKKAHIFANEHNLPIKLSGGHYVIKSELNIPIMTSCDFGDAVFHIDESVAKAWGFLFEVKKSNEWLTVPLEKIPLPLAKGTEIIPTLSEYEGHIVKIIDDNHPLGFRYGDPLKGRQRRDLFYVGQQGKLVGVPTWDYETITSIQVSKLPENYLTIQGGSFKLSGNLPATAGYWRHGFSITRPMTIIKDQKVSFETTDNSVGGVYGFYFAGETFDVTLKNVTIPSRKKAEGGSTYGLTAELVTKLTLDGVQNTSAEAYWGVMGTNEIQNFLIKDSKLSRVDTHFHVHNLTIKDSSVDDIQITGGGDLIVDNVKMVKRKGDDAIFINFRGDYGAVWDGNIFVKNSSIETLEDRSGAILNFTPYTQADFGYPIVFGKSIIIEDFDYRVIPTNLNRIDILGVTGNRNFNVNGPKFANYIRFKNIQLVGNDEGFAIFRTVDVNRLRSFTNNSLSSDGFPDVTNLTFEIDNVNLKQSVELPNNTNHNFTFACEAGAEYQSDSIVPYIILKNLKGLSLNLRSALAKVLIENCEVNTIYSTNKTSITLSNSTIKSNTKLSDTVKYSITHPHINLTLNNVEIYPLKIQGAVNLGWSLSRNGLFESTWDSALSKSRIKIFKAKHTGTRLSQEVYNHWAASAFYRDAEAEQHLLASPFKATFEDVAY